MTNALRLAAVPFVHFGLGMRRVPRVRRFHGCGEQRERAITHQGFGSASIELHDVPDPGIDGNVSDNLVIERIGCARDLFSTLRWVCPLPAQRR